MAHWHCGGLWEYLLTRAKQKTLVVFGRDDSWEVRNRKRNSPRDLRVSKDATASLLQHQNMVDFWGGSMVQYSRLELRSMDVPKKPQIFPWADQLNSKNSSVYLQMLQI